MHLPAGVDGHWRTSANTSRPSVSYKRMARLWQAENEMKPLTQGNRMSLALLLLIARIVELGK